MKHHHHLLLLLPLSSLLLNSSQSFTHLPTFHNHIQSSLTTRRRSTQLFHPIHCRLHSKSSSKKDDETPEIPPDSKQSMEAAFRSLDSLNSLDPDDDVLIDREKMKQFLEKKKTDSSPNDDDDDDDVIVLESDEALKEAPPRNELSSKDLKLYSEMLNEAEQEGAEEQMYSEVMGELSGQHNKTILPSSASAILDSEDDDATILVEEDTIFEDADGIGSGSISDQQKQDVLEKAIQEAVEMATTGGGGGTTGEDKGKLSDSILKDEEFKKELEAVFDEANRKLLDAVEEIRKDQITQNQQIAAKREESIQDDQTRLAEAQTSISSLIQNVNKETAEVESAMKQLEEAKQKMDQDPMIQMSNLKQAGLVKQSTLVLSFLFGVRSLTELVMNGGGGGGMESVAIQAGLAVLFAILFLVL